MRQFRTVFLLLLSLPSLAQLHPERVTGLPTNELHDLHVDKKGYLWIAHSLGISRYDGLNFINYSHPEQANLHSTDIIEDREGRLWFHNFSGQVFYIENGNIRLLTSYDFKKENQSPKMVLCGDELLITSYKGLFVCNTKSFITSFFPFSRVSPTALVSLSVANNKAVVYNNLDWYIYSHQQLKKAGIRSPLALPEQNFLSLQPTAYKDTVFLTANPSGILYKLTVENNQLRFLGKQDFHDFINAVSVEKDAWVHTRTGSINLETGVSIRSLDLTKMVTDKEGNRWYGSRREGLLVSYHPSLWQQASFQLDKDDYIRSLNANAGYFFVGTQKGTLYTFTLDSTKPVWKHELFNGLGSVDFIRYINNDRFIVGSTTTTYIVNARDKRIEDSLSIQSIQDVDFADNSFYLATTVGLFVVPYLNDPSEKQQWLQQKKREFPFFDWQDKNASAYLLLPLRTRSVRVDPVHHFVYASTKNGLLEVNKTGAHPFLINGKEVFSTTIAYKSGQLYIATINDGLWMAQGRTLRHFTTVNTLASNTLIRIKATEDHLWLFEKNGIQVLDINTGNVLRNLDLPKLEGANVLDVAEKGDFGYFTTSEGAYKLPLGLAAKKLQPKGYLDYVIVNGKDTLQGKKASLPYQQNDVQFYFSSPVFYDPEAVSFRYRLNGAENEWRSTAPGERMIRYSALTPGDYEFEFYANGSNGMQQAKSILFPFSINKPWWRTWWFFLLFNAAIVAVIYLIIQTRIHQKLRLELMRRNISSDLHDDIGATLSSVNFYIDLARSDTQNADYLHQIKKNVNQVITNLDDLVWSINPKNDTTAQFVHRMKDYAIPLLKAAQIQCHFQYESKLLALKLDLLTKRHLYLLFKEMVNNVAKHAQCRNCFIQLLYHHSKLVLSVTDDGLGFSADQQKKNRNGLFNMQERTRKLKGEMEIRSAEKQGSRIAITIPV